MKIHFSDKLVKYIENPQLSTSKFSFVNEISHMEFVEQFPPVKCRDYLGDIVEANATKKKFVVYGFAWNPEENSLDPDATKLCIHFDDKNECTRFLENTGVLAKIETENDLPPSKYYLHENGSCVVVIGDKFWQSAIWTISLYTYLLRSLGYNGEIFGTKFKGEIGWGGGYLSLFSKETWEKLLSNLKEIRGEETNLSGWTDGYEVYRSHNSSGFVTLFEDMRKYSWPENIYWSRFHEMQK